MKGSITSALKSTTWQSKWLRAAVAILLLMLAGGAAWYFLLGGKTELVSASDTTIGPDYYTTTVRRASLRISATGSGTLTVRKSVDLSFPASGTVIELNVKLGDHVSTGDVLARQGNSESLQASVAGAELLYLQAQQSLGDLQQNAAVSLAQAYQAWVSAQQAYNTSLFADQRMAYARCSEAVNVRNAKAVEQAGIKLKDLTLRDSGSDTWIDADHAYDMALANYEYCVAYTTDEKTNAKASLEVTNVTLQQAELKYNTLKSSAGIDPTQLSLAEAKVTQTKTQLAQAQKELEGSTMLASMDGTIIYLASNAGTFVDTAKYITLSDLSQPLIKVSLDETDLDKLAIGSRVEVVFDALPEETFNGILVGVDPQLTPANQSMIATGLVELDQGAATALQGLPLGLSATVDVIAKEVNNGLLIPIEALRDLGNKEYGVFVLDERGILRFTPVQVGVKDIVQVEVLSGLNAGDMISTGIAQIAQK